MQTFLKETFIKAVPVLKSMAGGLGFVILGPAKQHRRGSISKVTSVILVRL